MPVASLAAVAATRSSMRRYASKWAVGNCSHEMTFFLGAQGFMQPEGHGGLCAMGKQGSAPSGVYDYGTLEEDGPETWEALISPCEANRTSRRAGDQSPTRSALAGCVRCRPPSVA